MYNVKHRILELLYKYLIFTLSTAFYLIRSEILSTQKNMAMHNYT